MIIDTYGQVDIVRVVMASKALAPLSHFSKGVIPFRVYMHVPRMVYALVIERKKFILRVNVSVTSLKVFVFNSLSPFIKCLSKYGLRF